MLLSIIIPVYNIEKYLNRCIESIFHQSFTDYEIILVDDGSKDGSSKICDDYSNQDKRVRVIHKTNGGVSSARNLGVKEARGQYVMFIDGDDELCDETLSENMKYLLDERDIEIIEFPGYYHFGNNKIEFLIKEKNSISLKGNKKIINHWLKKPSFECWRKIYKRSLLNNILFDEKITVGEDLLFLIHVMSICKYYFVSEKGCYLYNYNESSAMNRESRDRSKDEIKLIERLSRVCDYPNRNVLLKFSYIVVLNYIYHPIKYNKNITIAWDQFFSKFSYINLLLSKIPLKVKLILLSLKCIRIKHASNIIKIKHKFK